MYQVIQLEAQAVEIKREDGTQDVCICVTPLQLSSKQGE